MDDLLIETGDIVFLKAMGNHMVTARVVGASIPGIGSQEEACWTGHIMNCSIPLVDKAPNSVVKFTRVAVMDVLKQEAVRGGG